MLLDVPFKKWIFVLEMYKRNIIQAEGESTIKIPHAAVHSHG